MVEPMQLHTCEMHGGLAIEQTPGAHGHSAAGHRMAMHPTTSHSNHQQGTDGQSQQCSCLGDCSGGSAPVGLTAAGVSLPEARSLDGVGSGFAYASPRLIAAGFLLPFGNGPPASSSRA
jgi:hypothetical protein